MIALILGLGLLEIAVWVLLAQFMSGWYVFFWFIAAFLIGLKLLKHSSRVLMPQLQQMQQQQRGGLNQTLPANLRGAVAQCLAAILLMIPGVITDIIALFLLIPFVRNKLADVALAAFAKRQQAMLQRMMGQHMQQNGFGDAADMSANPMFAEMLRQMQAQQQGRRAATDHDDGVIIEGEAREVMPDLKKIEQHPSKD